MKVFLKIGLDRKTEFVYFQDISVVHLPDGRSSLSVKSKYETRRQKPTRNRTKAIESHGLLVHATLNKTA
jgi:hypothetical protein